MDEVAQRRKDKRYPIPIDLPPEVFLNFILPLIALKEFVSLLLTSQSFNRIYDINETWKEFYLRRKQFVFRVNEQKKQRRNPDNIYRTQFPMPHSPLYAAKMKCKLLIFNQSPITYRIRYMSPNSWTGGNKVLLERGNHKNISPGQYIMIISYIGHTWEFSHEYNLGDNNEESYRTIYKIINSNDIRDYTKEELPDHIRNSKFGMKKLSNSFDNLVIVNLTGNKYDVDSCKEELALVHPLNSLKNFKNYKKQHMKLFQTEMKEKLKKNNESLINLEDELKEEKYTLYFEKNKLLMLEKKFQEMESFVIETRNVRENTEQYFRTLTDL
jgi:hypothetical protein